MKLAIMQPYLFPYIGYFQLINAVDKFIFYDDVNYIKKGWINRNRILVNHKDYLFTLPLKSPSQNKLINQTEIYQSEYISWRKKYFNTIELSYKKAPYFEQVFDLIQNCIKENELYNISDIAINSIINVCSFLGLKSKFEISSKLFADNKDLKKAKRLIDICKKNYAKIYINPLGGKRLYSKEDFKKEGIDLFFIKTKDIVYKQFENEFVANLSIIDVMMFNSKEEVTKMLNEYQLI